MAHGERLDDSSYIPSGRVGWQVIPALLLGCVAAAVSAWAYAAAIVRLPFLMNGFVVCFFAAWLGWLTSWTCRLGKVRNTGWMVRAGTAIALAGWYSHWCAWSVLMVYPRAAGYIWELILELYVHAFTQPWYVAAGAVGLSNLADSRPDSWRIGGYWIVPFWVLEFLIMMGFSRSGGRDAARLPFCEKSGSWAVPMTLPQRFSPLTYRGVIKEMIRVNPAALAVLFRPLPQDTHGDYATVTLYLCRAGGAYLSVSDWKRSGAREADRHEWKVLTHEHLGGVDVDALVSALERRASQAPIAGEAGNGSRAKPSELAFARRRLHDADHAMARSLATPHLRSAKPEVRRVAVKLCALAAEGLGRWSEARAHWLAVFDDDPGVQAASKVAITSVMAGDVAQGGVWFDTAKLYCNYGDADDLAWPTIVLSMLTALGHRGETRASLRYVEALRDIYAGEETTNPANEYLQDMPLFGDFLNDSLPIVRAALPEAEWRAWYEAISDDIDDAGRRQLHAWLDAQLAPAA